jgi:hypothetical protein
MSNSFEQQRQRLQEERLAQISGGGAKHTGPAEDTDKLIALDDAKRKQFRAERAAKQEARLQQLNGSKECREIPTQNDQSLTNSSPPQTPASSGSTKNDSTELTIPAPSPAPASMMKSSLPTTPPSPPQPLPTPSRRHSTKALSSHTLTTGLSNVPSPPPTLKNPTSPKQTSVSAPPTTTPTAKQGGETSPLTGMPSKAIGPARGVADTFVCPPVPPCPPSPPSTRTRNTPTTPGQPNANVTTPTRLPNKLRPVPNVAASAEKGTDKMSENTTANDGTDVDSSDSKHSEPLTQPSDGQLPTTVSENTSSLTDTQPPSVTLPFSPARLGAQIKTDIGRIAGQTNDSSLRSLVTGYLQKVSPFFKDDGDAALPRALHVHPVQADRCSSPGFGDVVLFHIGNAVLSYYDIENGTFTQGSLDSIQFLHEIAVIGISSHRVKGGDARGYTLFAVENHDRLKEDDA